MTQSKLSSPEASTALKVDAGVASPYWQETRRPLNNLIFLVPLLLFYESGVILAAAGSGHSVRNGADAWLRLILNQAGIAIDWLPPLLLLGCLTTWQWVTRQSWTPRWDTFGGMAAESFLYAFALILVGQFTDFWFRNSMFAHLNLAPTYLSSEYYFRLITFMGAGIYEEFLFRLCLVPLVYGALRLFLVPRRGAIVATIVLTSCVFSLAHYLGPLENHSLSGIITEALQRVRLNRDLWFSFTFRTIAGAFFAVLYFARGFGITVGAHAAYDVFVGLVLIQEL